MKKVSGDLMKLAADGQFDVIVHGCNCGNTMGAGIAKQIKREFPSAYRADCQTTKWDRSKLGTATAVAVRGRDSHEFVIVNGYTQFHWRGEGTLVDYDALRSVMRGVKNRYGGRRIGYPKIGAGLAKGDWAVIGGIIDEELEGEDHTLVQFST